MKICKRISSVLCIVLCFAILSSTPASAYHVWYVGSDSVTDNGLDVALQGYVYYNSYTSTALDINSMQTIIWNASENIDIDESYFRATNGTRDERSDDYWPQFYQLAGGPISANAHQHEVNTINWSELVSLYNKNDTIYSYTSGQFCVTDVGFRVETVVGGISYYYFFSTYWLPTLERNTIKNF